MSNGAPLYERDPQAWRAHLAEGNATQPRKRVGADMVIRDRHDRILLVDPQYKPDWDLPGGMSEANEPPAETARREVKEELGLDTQPGALLCVDWVSPHGPWDDSLMFIFDGGVLNDEQATSLRLLDGELAAFEFCTSEEASERLRLYVWRRLSAALDALTTRQAVYLQDGWHAQSFRVHQAPPAAHDRATG
ncbi:MAG TPA: NUDIX hydrolase [Streptosporangiaceae bacterium]|nr:NUDIX hydrolase [Streptosporangiaceae bacterium]